jgi:DtxR family Mn-dependent transcriptional regulator
MIRRLATDGMVTIEGGIKLTELGLGLAEQVVRRHRLAERFLVDILGLHWAEAHAEAGKWEHVLSASVEAAINRILENPTTCPHGNPIPGTAYRPDATVALADLGIGEDFTVTRIPEELEFAPGMLSFLEDNHITPGRRGVLTASSPDGTVTVRIEGETVGIGAFAGSRILVSAS